MRKSLLFLGALLIGGIITNVTPAEAYPDPPYYEHGAPITIHIDGEYLPCDVDPVVKNNRTLMPMRAAGEALGATVNWNQPSQTITLAKDNRTIKFILNSKTYYINNTAYTTDVPPIVIQGRTLIPLRVFAEALNTRVDWDQYLLDVSISTTGEPATLPQVPIDTFDEVSRWLQKYYTSNANDILGNWTRKYTFYGTNVTDYEFFYKLPSGYQNITISVELPTPISSPIITISKNDTWQTQEGYSRNNYQTILYYKGPGRGFTSYFESEYKTIDSTLVHTGTKFYELGTSMVSEYESTYDIYKRF